MSPLPPTSAELLRWQLERLFEGRGDKSPPFVGIRVAGPYGGPPRMEVAGAVCQLVFCPSVLAFRENLGEPLAAAEVRVLLTDRPQAELGLDVLTRLRGRRLYEIDRWELLQRAFGASRLDSRLHEYEWLTGELLGALPSTQFRQPASGTLDLETVWRTFLEHRLLLPGGRCELPDLLRFAEADDKTTAFTALPAQVAAATLEWVRREGGAGAAAIASLLGDGRAADVVPLGLVCRVLFHPAAEGAAERQLAVVRLERYLPEPPPPSAARLWADEAELLLVQLRRAEVVEGGARTRQILARADQWLEELRAAPWAGLSDFLRSGLLRRREALAAAITALLAQTPARYDAGLELAARSLSSGSNQHSLREHDRLGGAGETEPLPIELLVQACRWLAEKEAAPVRAGSFAAACRLYAEVTAGVDQARQALRRWALRLGEGGLEGALRSLLGRLATARERENVRFGELAAGYLAADTLPEEPGGIELVPIEEVLARCLVPLAREGPVLLLVLDGLSLAAFHELLPDLSARGWRELSPKGGRRPVAVAALPTISEVCRASLFAGRLERGQQAFEKKALATAPQLRVLGAANLPPLLFHQSELRAEHGAGLAEEVRREILRVQRRVVAAVINVVEGHLSQDEQVPQSGSAENIGPLASLLEAADAAGRTVLLTADYRGGASPQEMLLPLAIFTTAAAAPEGFAETALKPPPAVPGAAGRAGLWARLAASELFRETLQELGLAPETVARIGVLVDEIDRQGNSCPLELLENRLAIPRLRLRSLVAQTQRLLHLDGYVVLELDDAGGRLRLDRQVLARQFGLEDFSDGAKP